MTDPVDLEAIDARVNAATPGPWEWQDVGEHGYPQRIVGNDDGLVLVEILNGGPDRHHLMPVDRTRPNRPRRHVL